ncbi:MAG: hypothetical protein H6906_13665 [Hyphomicrobiales bacterium]|nr:hypothetical protein [Hyphomicrobiales bacterium]
MTLWFARQPFADLWGYILTLEPHPPLYYSLQRLWLAFGDGAAALRALSTVFAVATVPLVYLLGRAAGGHGGPGRGLAAGFVAALLFALAPLQVQYGQEARGYAALAFAQTLILCGGAWLVRHPSALALPPWSAAAPAAAWAAVAGGAGLSLWLHNTAVLYLGVLFLFLLAWLTAAGLWRRQVAVNLALAVALVVLVWAPYWPWLWHHARDVERDFWIPAPDLASVLKILNDLFGAPYLWRLGAPMIAAMAALAAWGAWSLWRARGWPLPVLLLTALAGPLAAHLAVSLAVRPILLTRPLIAAGVPFLVLVAAGATALPGRGKAAVAARVAVMVFLVAAQGRAFGNFAQSFAKEPWDRVAAALRAEVRPGEPVYVYPHYATLPLEVALARDGGGALDLHPLPAPFPGAGIRSLPLTPQARAELAQARHDHPRVWLVVRTQYDLDKQDDAVRTVRQDRRTADERQIRQLRVWRFE